MSMASLTWAGASRPRLTEATSATSAVARGSRPGKALETTTSVLAGFTLLLGLAGLAAWEVADQDTALSPIWLHWLLLVGVPTLVTLTQRRAERRAARTVLAIQDLAKREAEIPRDYFRIGPYLDVGADRDDFDRADGAHLLVLEWLQRAEALPLYLTGHSGTGKTSLLNACVLPALRAQGWTVVSIRASDDILAALFNTLPGGSWGQAVSVRDQIEAAAREVDAPLLLVLDQFEEFLIQAAPDQRQAFAALVADLDSRPIANLRLLLVPRDDFTTDVVASGLPELVQGQNTMRIGSLPVEAARSLLIGEKAGLPDELLDRLLTSAAALDATPNLVRPITLNVLGFIVKSRRLTDLAPTEAGRLLRDYLTLAVDAPVIRDHSRQVLAGLIAARATTRARSATDLSSETALRVAEVRTVLKSLTTAGLVRPLAQDFWKLSHDYLAEAVTAHLNCPRPGAWRRTGRYAAPALMALTLPMSFIQYRANLVTVDKAVASLRENGITLDVAMGSATASWTDHRRLVNVDELVPFLLRLRVQNLDLISAPIDELGALRRMTGLQALNLSHTYTADIEPLRMLTRLRSLDLAGTRAANLTALQSMGGLRSLNLAGTPAANLEPLRHLSVLRSLDLSRTEAANLEPLRKLSALRSLDLSRSAVTDIEALRGLPSLEALVLADTRVADFDPLRSVTALRLLDLTGTRITALKPLAGLTGLRSLRLWRTQVRDLDPLRGLSDLRTLDVAASPIATVVPLRGLVALRSLDLSETAVANIEPLRGMRALASLDLSGCPVTNLKPLWGLPALAFLDVRLTKASPDEIDSFIKARAKMGLPAVEVLR